MSARPARAVSLAVALSLLGDSMLYAVLPARYDDFGLPLAAVGLILSVNRYVRLLTNPLAARVYDRFGLRAPFMAATVVGALTTVVYGLAPGLALFVAARLLWGASWSLLRLGGYLASMYESGPARLARGLGTFHAISRLGSLVGMLLGGLLADEFGAPPTLLLFGLISLLGLPLAWTAPLAAVHPPSARAAVPPGQRWWSGLLTGGQSGAAGRRTAAAHAATLWSALANAIPVSTLGLLLRLRFGEEIGLLGLALGVATLTGAVLSARWVMDLAVAPLAGALVDRIGPRLAGPVCAGLAAGGLVGLAAADGLPAVLAATGVVFVGGSALGVVLESVVGRLAAPSARARAMGAYSTWSDLGSASGPALGFALVGLLGLPWIYGLAGLGLLGVAAVLARAAPPAAA